MGLGSDFTDICTKFRKLHKDKDWCHLEIPKLVCTAKEYLEDRKGILAFNDKMKEVKSSEAGKTAQKNKEKKEATKQKQRVE